MENKLLEQYNFAEQEDIDVDWIDMVQADSLSIELPDGAYCIALNPWKISSTSKELVLISHELGHCMTGSFYNPESAFDVRQKHENRADKWAIEATVPRNEFQSAVAEGHTELWDLADFFGVTEEFMKKAICWYKYGNLAVDYYM